MKDTLNPEERLSLCRLLLNRTGWKGCDAEVRKTAVNAVFELTTWGHIEVEWLKLVEKCCELSNGELDYWTGLVQYRTKS